MGLATLFQSLLKIVIYYFETILIGLAVKWAVGSASISYNSSIIKDGFQLLSICFFQLIALTWIGKLVKKLVEVKDDEIKQINLFNFSTNTKYKSVVDILWLPSIVTMMQLLVFLGNISAIKIITYIVFTVYFVMLGMWQVASDYKSFYEKNYSFKIVLKKSSKLKNWQRIVNLGVTIYFFFLLLENLKVKFSKDAITFENTKLNSVYFIFILISLLIGFLPLLKRSIKIVDKKSIIEMILVWAFEGLLNIASIIVVICNKDAKLLNCINLWGVVVIATVNLFFELYEIITSQVFKKIIESISKH